MRERPAGVLAGLFMILALPDSKTSGTDIKLSEAQSLNFAVHSKEGIPIQHHANVTKFMKFLGSRIIVVLLLGFSGCAHYHERKLEPEKTLSSFEDRSLENPRLQSFLATNQPLSTARWQAPQLAS